MDSGLLVGIFVFGVAIGALLESFVRSAFKEKLHCEFVDELTERLANEETPESSQAVPFRSVSRTKKEDIGRSAIKNSEPDDQRGKDVKHRA